MNEDGKEQTVDLNTMTPAELRERASELWPRAGVMPAPVHELDRALTPAAIRQMWRNREITVN